MSCESARRQLDPLLDGELGIERSLDVQAHLDACPACARKFAELRRLRTTLGSHSLRFDAPDGLRERVRASLPPSGIREGRPAAGPGRVSRAVAPGIFALAALLLVGFLFRPLRAPTVRPEERIADEVLSGHLRSLMGTHLADVLSSDRHTVKPYFAGKLDFAPPVIDLTAQGFPLAAGRLDYLDGHPAAAVVYRHGKHVINLFIWPRPDNDVSARATPVESVRRGCQIVHWSANGMEEWAVSDMGAAELRQFVADLQRQGG